jgi:hypothetical protein
MPVRLLFVLLAAVALLGCVARPAACKPPPHVADLAVESLDVDLDVDLARIVTAPDAPVMVAYIVAPAWPPRSRSIPSTQSLAGHQESGP